MSSCRLPVLMHVNLVCWLVLVLVLMLLRQAAGIGPRSCGRLMRGDGCLDFGQSETVPCGATARAHGVLFICAVRWHRNPNHLSSYIYPYTPILLVSGVLCKAQCSVVKTEGQRTRMIHDAASLLTARVIGSAWTSVRGMDL